ncbi:hypothetical protein [Acidovorax sp. sic0104]|jgi:hypothetical protein|uniref:hypothetical protein n=1 Tax=Acidovorax sp. sic0104 TaxID=2854784 RepID=UPI001C442866|nr:hypothetical protein [Acidovorax sp. sic0104]MBV7542974.1 hypothetical protein [Acidovorax sp. sic0104]
MNPLFMIASAMLAAVALAHSVLGEILVFRSLRTHGVVPTAGRPVLREAHVRILWGSWHLVSVLGLALSAVLWRLGTIPWTDTALAAWIADTAGMATLASGLLVFFATRGRHPAWIPLMAVAALVWWR